MFGFIHTHTHTHTQKKLATLHTFMKYTTTIIKQNKLQMHSQTTITQTDNKLEYEKTNKQTNIPIPINPKIA